MLDFLSNWRFRRRIARLQKALGIPADYGALRSLPLRPEARRLEPIGPDLYGREQHLLAPAAAAWRSMAEAAAADGVVLQVVSAFRSVDYQAGIVRRKLEQGQELDAILAVSAAPGYSEHHTGRALDLTAPGYAVLEEEFEHSPAFAWLQAKAPRFGFRMSFPRDNPHGVAYEPWHWAWWGDRNG